MKPLTFFGITTLVGLTVTLYFFNVTSAREIKGLEVDNTRNQLKTAQCQTWNNISMIGLVPNTGLNCSIFYLCTPTQPGSGFPPTLPSPMECQSGDDGILFYDFRKGVCDHDESKCFNWADDDHVKDYFICAEPYVPGSEDGYTGCQSNVNRK